MGARNWSCRIKKLAGSEAYESLAKFMQKCSENSKGPVKLLRNIVGYEISTKIPRNFTGLQNFATLVKFLRFLGNLLL